MLKQIRLIPWLLLVIVSCRDAKTTSGRIQGGANDAPMRVHTRVSGVGMRLQPDKSVVIRTGERVVARCLVRRGNDRLDNVPSRAVAQPPLPVLQVSTVETVFLAAAPGVYRVRCVAGGQPQVVDPAGVALLVQDGTNDDNSGDESEAPASWESDAGPTRPGDSSPRRPNPPTPAPSPNNGGPRGNLSDSANLPYAWDAHWPDGATEQCYWQNRPQLLLHNLVRNRRGDVLPNVPIRITSEPPAEINNDLGSITFAAPGTYHVVAEVLGPHAPDAQPSLRLTHTFVVDSTPPRIEIITPQRAAMVQSGTFEPSAVQVQGVIEDDTGLAHVTVNGQRLAVSPGEKRHAFTTTMQAPWGLNVLSVEAEDTCGVNAHYAQSYLRSPNFAKDVSQPARAVTARLSQAVFDDGHRGLTTISGHHVADNQAEAITNVATLVENALRAEDFRKLFPDHLSAWPDADGNGRLEEITDHCWWGAINRKVSGYEIVRSGDFSFRQAAVESVTLQPGGFVIQVSFTDLVLPARVDQYVSVKCVGAHRDQFWASIEAKHLTLTFTVKVYDSEPRLRVDPDGVRAEFVSGEPHLDLKTMGLLTHLGPGSLVNQLKDGVFTQLYRGIFSKALEERLRREVVRLMAGFLDSLHLNDTLHLPAPLQGPVRFVAGVDHLRVEGQGSKAFGELSMSGALIAEHPGPVGYGVTSEPQRGPIRAAPIVPNLSMRSDQTVSIALYDDFLNQALHALWAQNAFTVADLPGLLRANGIAMPLGMEMYFFASLPPVIMPGHTPGEVVLGWGDNFINAQFDLARIAEDVEGGVPVNLTLFASLRMPAKLGFDDQGNLTLQPSSDPEVWLEVVHVNDLGYQTLASQELELMLGRGLPRLREALQTALPELVRGGLASVPLPTFRQPNGDVRRLIWNLQDASLERPPQVPYSVLHGRLVATPAPTVNAALPPNSSSARSP